MNIPEILKLINFLDKLVFDKRKENLTPVEKAILEAVLKDKKLDNIQINGYSNGYIKTTLAQKLWKLLSGVTGEKVKRNTVQIVIENLYQKKDMERSQYEESSKFPNINNSISNEITDNNSYHDTSSKSAEIDDYEQFNKGDYIDDKKITPTNFDHGWGTIPNMGDSFHNRITELTTLTEYINNNCRLIAITGMPGMGKTFLAATLVNQIKTNFDYVLWRSISDYSNFNSFLDSITQILPIERENNNQIAALIQCFVHHRCLLVIDGMETIFTDNSLAGIYQKEWVNFGKFLTEVGVNNHVSCLLLTSGEKPKKLGLLEGENSPVRSLVLSGLTEEESTKILIDKGLNESQYFATLIKLYSGNPLALKLVADIIKDVFGGNIVNYLQHSTIFSHEFSLLLSQLFNRLSPLEMSMIYWLAIYEKSANLAQLKNDFFRK
ncbi:MAG TPA: NB-ARC domain-containing protein [Allocoleopsis sp.]